MANRPTELELASNVLSESKELKRDGALESPLNVLRITEGGKENKEVQKDTKLPTDDSMGKFSSECEQSDQLGNEENAARELDPLNGRRRSMNHTTDPHNGRSDDSTNRERDRTPDRTDREGIHKKVSLEQLTSTVMKMKEFHLRATDEEEKLKATAEKMGVDQLEVLLRTDRRFSQLLADGNDDVQNYEREPNSAPNDSVDGAASLDRQRSFKGVVESIKRDGGREDDESRSAEAKTRTADVKTRAAEAKESGEVLNSLSAALDERRSKLKGRWERYKEWNRRLDGLEKHLMERQKTFEDATSQLEEMDEILQEKQKSVVAKKREIQNLETTIEHERRRSSIRISDARPLSPGTPTSQPVTPTLELDAGFSCFDERLDTFPSEAYLISKRESEAEFRRESLRVSQVADFQALKHKAEMTETRTRLKKMEGRNRELMEEVEELKRRLEDKEGRNEDIEEKREESGSVRDEERTEESGNERREARKEEAEEVKGDDEEERIKKKRNPDVIEREFVVEGKEKDKEEEIEKRSSREGASISQEDAAAITRASTSSNGRRRRFSESRESRRRRSGAASVSAPIAVSNNLSVIAVDAGVTEREELESETKSPVKIGSKSAGAGFMSESASPVGGAGLDFDALAQVGVAGERKSDECDDDKNESRKNENDVKDNFVNHTNKEKLRENKHNYSFKNSQRQRNENNQSRTLITKRNGDKSTTCNII